MARKTERRPSGVSLNFGSLRHKVGKATKTVAVSGDVGGFTLDFSESAGTCDSGIGFSGSAGIWGLCLAWVTLSSRRSMS